MRKHKPKAAARDKHWYDKPSQSGYSPLEHGAAMTMSSEVTGFLDRVKRLSPEVRERLRARRPGYDAILGLVGRYESLGSDEKRQLQEIGLLQQYVIPMFQAFGWAADKVGLQQTRKFVVDIVLDYKDLHVPVEVKRYGNELDAQAESDLLEAAMNSHSDFGILTNFDRIRVFTFRPQPSSVTSKAQPPDVPMFETSPQAYVLDEEPRHDLIAAPFFFDQIASRKETVGESSGELKDQKGSRIEVASRAVADLPSTLDMLGYSVYADALADFIKNERTGKPLTIGIDAPWGMGKTTLMQMIRERLVVRDRAGGNPRPLPHVWFNAWGFDQTETLWAAITLSILKAVRSTLTWKQRLQLWRTMARRSAARAFAARLLERVARLLLFVLLIVITGGLVYSMAIAGMLTVLPKDFQDFLKSPPALGAVGLITTIVWLGIQSVNIIFKAFDIKVAEFVSGPKYEERVNFISEFQSDFREIGKIVTDDGKRPIVVFIDDLERAQPPRPAEIMEAINLFLGSEYTIFVIGMDARMVAGSIEAKYAGIREFVSDDDEPGGLRLGQRFLEKITQVHFRIPHAEPSAFRNLVRGNVLDVDEEPQQASPQEVARVQALIHAEQQTGKSIDQAAAAVTNQRPDIAEHVIRKAQQELIAKSLDDSPEFQRAVDTATRYLGFNPRKFKRFLNNFRLTAMIFNRRGLFDQGMFQLPVLANWTIMATRWPDLSDALTADPKFIELLKQAFEVNAKVREVQQRGASAEEVDLQLRHLNAYLRNRYVKRLIDADDLRTLLNAMPEAETQSLSMYANYGASSDTLPAGP